MKPDDLNQLLYEEESPNLDFKRDQYPFAKATEEQKSELLKDILGFVNCWRRAEAFILVGVEEVRGGRSIVHGVSDHLHDHSLQQFVNSLTNRPVLFRYEACEIDGMQVGVIRIEQQRRPVFLKRDYGKLKKEEVYVRRGSSTDPMKPADPDEIAMMGSERGFPENEADLTVEFADTEREQSLGDNINWTAEYCEVPKLNDIPDFDDTPAPIRLPGGETIHVPSFSSLSFDNRLNSQFLRQLANYTFFHKLVKKMRLVVANQGESPASDVRLELCIENGSGFGIIESSDAPDVPKKRLAMFGMSAMKSMKIRPALRHPGYVDIDKNDHETKIEIDCGSLQPGRKVWTDAFFLGIGQSGSIQISGQMFSGNLSKPKPFALSISAVITRSQMTVEQLFRLGEPNDNEK